MPTPTALAIQNTRRDVQRALKLVHYRALLGDASGVVDEPGRAGYVRVRYTSAAGLTLPTVVRCSTAILKNPDTPVWVGFDYDNELAVEQGDFAGFEQAGINPNLLNAADPAYRFPDISLLGPLRSYPTYPPSLLVVVDRWMYLRDGTWYEHGRETVDLSASVPAAGLQRIAGIFLKTDQTLEVKNSTSISTGDVIGLADVQECTAAASAGSLPVVFWKLSDAQTTIDTRHLYLDGRQWINASDAGRLSGVTAGAYTSADITVDAYGRVTVAASGGGGTTDDSARFLGWRGYS